MGSGQNQRVSEGLSRLKLKLRSAWVTWAVHNLGTISETIKNTSPQSHQVLTINKRITFCFLFNEISVQCISLNPPRFCYIIEIA